LLFITISPLNSWACAILDEKYEVASMNKLNNKKPPFLPTAATKKNRRSGGLPGFTHQPGRSMTLRPRLAKGLPFLQKFR
jgi:hypothetical protein